VLASWLLELVQVSWRLYAHIVCFIDKSRGEPFDVPLVEAIGRFRFATSLDFTQSCRSPGAFRDWLISEVVRRVAPSHWKLRTAAQITPSPPPPVAVSRRRYLAVDRVYGVARWRWLLSVYVHLLPKRAARPPLPAPGAPRDYFPASFLELVSRLAGVTMPETAMAGFDALHADAKHRSYRAGRLRITTPNPYDDQENVMLGCAIDAGERLVMSQHGGTYGWGDGLSINAETDYVHDAFITWGWTEQQDYAGRFVRLPSPMLSRNLGKHQPVGNDIVLVGNAMTHFNPRIDFVPCPMLYRRQKRRFVDGLAAHVIDDLRYRPYRKAKTIDDEAWMRRLYPNLRMVDGILEPALFASKLVVIDHPGTTLIVTLAGNIPTIAFWDREAWPLARQAKALFTGLEEAGILFHDPDRAAAQVNVMWPHVAEWWHDPVRQKARTEWCERFAWAEPLWLLYWFKGLARL
jgi:putative transferase (TIGR04331 family)